MSWDTKSVISMDTLNDKQYPRVCRRCRDLYLHVTEGRPIPPEPKKLEELEVEDVVLISDERGPRNFASVKEVQKRGRGRFLVTKTDKSEEVWNVRTGKPKDDKGGYSRRFKNISVPRSEDIPGIEAKIGRRRNVALANKLSLISEWHRMPDDLVAKAADLYREIQEQ